MQSIFALLISIIYCYSALVTGNYDYPENGNYCHYYNYFFFVFTKGYYCHSSYCFFFNYWLLSLKLFLFYRMAGISWISNCINELDYRNPVLYVIPIQSILKKLPVVPVGDTGTIPYYFSTSSRTHLAAGWPWRLKAGWLQ